MPAIDYVSIVKSVYKDRRSLVSGGIATVLGVSACAIKTGSLVLYAHAVLFVVVTVLRYIDFSQFRKVQLGPTDVETAAVWELRATFWAGAVAFAYGSWCFSSMVLVGDPVVELLAFVTTTAAMVGVVTRNFGLDRMLTLQLIIAITLMSSGLVLKFNVYYFVLLTMLLPMLISMRFLAADVRNVLLSAVHGRVEANRLAGQLDTALETMHHGLCMLDQDGLITVVNDRAEMVFAGFVAGNWKGRPFAALIAAAAARGTVPQRAAEKLLDTVAQHGVGKVILRLANSEYCEVTVSSRADRTVLLFEDITDRVKAEERINYMAHYDALTGLLNRGFFSEQVNADLDRLRGLPPGNAAMLIIVDVDDFKHVNDTHGHMVGDRLLVDTAERLKRVLGRGTMIARLGGDEFVVYRSGPAGADNPEAIAAQLIETFQEPFLIMGERLAVNISAGLVVQTDLDGEDLDTFMVKADLALYKAKANGKAQAQLFHEQMDTDYRYRQRLKADLAVCVAANGLTLVYQPIIDLRTRRVVCCEALARWNHPEFGAIPPSVFIPIAEETGLISDITRFVLASAVAECRNWPDDIAVSVNISARDFRHTDVKGMVEATLRDSGLPAHRLEIEVTETALIEERDAATKILSALQAQGIGIALDDFGTGYSSLSYLQALPFTKLKVDRSFVVDVVHNPRALKLLKNVVQLGKDIDLKVTAEGVETEEQLAVLAAHTKVDHIQGYLFGIPLPRRDVAELIDRLAGVSYRAQQPRKLVNQP
ncbi:putative bifunctional diguanylate cyclase/phosphodiesterase [Devosia enhydra]|nr:EAL domain-containing protein [Devosia enhydra]